MPSVGDTFEHYRLDAEIDRAGQSTCAFHATDLHGDLEVALEILRDTASSVERARFGTRTRRLAPVRHSALTTVLEIGKTHCAFEAPAGPQLSEHAGVAIARWRQKMFWLAMLA